MNLLKITLYSVLKEHFFDLLYNINCNAREYVGCTNVDRYFDIERVEREELVDIELGVKISRPVVVERELIGGGDMFSSLSHNGVLAIYYYKSGSKYQLTDLVKERQIEIEVEGFTQTGFYDESMVMLTLEKPLRVCSVEEMFSEKDVSVMKEIGVGKVSPLADVTLLNSTRVLVFTLTSFVLEEFDVDTFIIRKSDIGVRISSFASLTGIDVGVKGVFRKGGNKHDICLLGWDNSISLVSNCNFSYFLSMFIPSLSDPRDIKTGMKIYYNGSFFTSMTKWAQLTTPFNYCGYQSIVRLYQNIFLVYDAKIKKWCLVKIIVL